MDAELMDVDVSEILFKDQLGKTDYSVVFIVVVRDKTYAMKVHHGRGPKLPYEPTWRETNIFICESSAYRRLTERGLCARGITPRFYGTIENIDPALCQPHLKDFKDDEYPATAILLEYIPNMRQLHWSNYTEKRMQNFVDGINEIHKVMVCHLDAHPRNMMVVDDDPERAIWIDFDRAQTFNEGDITDRQKSWFVTEKAIVVEMAGYMKADAAEEKTNQTHKYYV